MLELKYSRAASADIDEIWLYIATESANIEVADRIVDEIRQAVNYLREFPKSGHLREDLADIDVRFKQVHRWLIAYTEKSNTLIVLNIVHSARDFWINSDT